MITLFRFLFYIIVTRFQSGYSSIFNNIEDIQKFTIEENQPPKTFVGRIKFNKQFEEQFTYSFSEISDWFIIDQKTGDILTSKVIDLEALCINSCTENEYGTIPLSVNIRKQNNLITMVKVVVNVIDVDDNKPEFQEQEFVKEIKEVIHRKHMVINLPAAVDRDILLKHREINYRIFGDHSAFHLEENNFRGPKLRIMTDIDYEKQKEYKFTLSAFQKNAEDMAANLNITLKVVNINDCAPEFNKTQYEVSVYEDIILDEILIKVKAFDADGDKLKYSFIPNSVYFQINSEGEIRLIQRLDYEKHQFYSYTIQATDGEFLAETKLKVNILDVNDESPSYILNPSKLFIDETNKSGILVGQITIFDRDSLLVNRRVGCSESNVESQALRLELDRISTFELVIYKLYTVYPLDREKIPDGIVYTNLMCYDKGVNRQLHTNISIPLHVYDINDNPPTFPNSQYQVSVKENNEIGLRIFQAQATDIDIGKNAQVLYDIQTSMDSDLFIIDPQSGWIKLMQSLDREKKNQCMITIIATDQAVQDRKSGYTKLIINVLDENDNVPELKDASDLAIIENLPIGHYIGTLVAHDKDEGENAKVTFRLSLESIFQPISINLTGSIFSNQVFDREKMSKVCTLIQLSDSARVNVLTSQVPICINIMDENDNYPQISLMEKDEITPIRPLFNNSYDEHSNVDYAIKMSIREKVGFIVAVVKAKDNDTNNISQLSYFLETAVSDNLHQPIFEIDKRSGRLIINRPLHRDLLGTHKIKIMVEDSGTPSLKSAKNVIVQILDIPQFSSKVKSTNSSIQSPFIGNNFMISLILSVVSALLILILISVIICIVKPCTGRERFRNQPYESNYVPSLMFQDQVRHLSPDLVEKQKLEISGNMEGIWGGNTLRKQNSLTNVEQNWQSPRTTFGPSNDIYLETIQKNYQNNEYNSQSQYMSNFNNQNAIRLLVRNDEQRSDSGKGASDDDMAYVPRFISDPMTMSRNGYSAYNATNPMQILPFPGCVFNCSSASYPSNSTSFHQSTTECDYITDTYLPCSTHVSTNI